MQTMALKFIHSQLLYWLEVLSIRGVSGRAPGILGVLMKWIPVSWFTDSYPEVYTKCFQISNEELRRDTTDALKFVRVFGRPIALSVPHIYVSALAFAPLGSRTSSRYLANTFRALGCRDKNVGNLNWQPLEGVLHGHPARVSKVAFSPDGALIVSCGEDIRIWDAEAMVQIAVLTENQHPFALSPDGKYLVSQLLPTTEDSPGILSLWNVRTRVEVGVFRGHKHEIIRLAFTSDGTRVVSYGWNDVIRIWDIETQHQVGEIGMLSSCAMTFSPDGKHIVASFTKPGLTRFSYKPYVGIWDVETQVLVREGELELPLKLLSSSEQFRPESIVFSPDAATAWGGCTNGDLIAWDVKTQSRLAVLEGHTSSVTSVAISPDGRCLASGSDDNTIRIWDIQTKQQIGEPLECYASQVCIAFSPDGTHIVSGSTDETVSVWDVEVNLKRQTPQYQPSSMTIVGISPCGTLVASVSVPNQDVQIWDADTQLPIGLPLQPVPAGPLGTVEFSSDGTQIIAKSNGDQYVCMWDTETHLRIAGPFLEHRSAPDFPPYISVSGSTVILWDIPGGTKIAGELFGHTDHVDCVALFSDGVHLASGSTDLTIRIWNLQTRLQIGEPFKGHTHLVESVAISLDGSRLVSASQDQTIRIWDLKSQFNAVTGIAFNTMSVFHSFTLLGSPDPLPGLVNVFDDNNHFVTNIEQHKDGWIVGPGGELILWVPNYLILRLPRAYLVGICRGEPMLTFDTSGFHHGTQWTRCKRE
jgi:WD40 repeat protein